MKKFFKNRCVLGLLIIVVVFGIVVGIVNATSTEATFFENVSQVIFAPVQKLVTRAGNGINDFFGYFSNVDKLKKELENVKTENGVLKNQLSNSESALIENEQLRELLSLKEAFPDLELETAEIIAREPANWYFSFTVDKGTADGIAVNMPVISADKSLVGRICEVGTTWSKIVTINNLEHAAGAEVSRSGERGIIEGDAELTTDGNCRLSYISKNANIVAGDNVITTGQGGIYPKGLNIGKVVEVRPDIQGISQYAVVKPTADIKNLRAISIIKNVTKN